MPSEKLEHAIDAIHVRFGDQALVRGRRLPAAQPWPTGLPAVDRLSGIGGLPRGRITVLQGPLGSGKMSLAEALLARATLEHARVVVIDNREFRFDPWVSDLLGAKLDVLTLLRPRTPADAGEAAGALVGAGVGFALVLEELPDASVARLESAAARSGSLVLAVAGREQRALAHASSLTLEMEWLGMVHQGRLPAGARSLLRCVKNKLAAPGAEAELVLRYPLAPVLPEMAAPVEVKREAVAGELWASEVS